MAIVRGRLLQTGPQAAEILIAEIEKTEPDCERSVHDDRVAAAKWLLDRLATFAANPSGQVTITRTESVTGDPAALAELASILRDHEQQGRHLLIESSAVAAGDQADDPAPNARVRPVHAEALPDDAADGLGEAGTPGRQKPAARF